MKSLQPQFGKILALDYGKSKIGAAISDETRSMVFGRGRIDCKNGLNAFFEKLRMWCTEDDIATIVIGLPYNQEGKETAQTRRIRNFAKKLEHFLNASRLAANIVFEDESFSSFEATEHLTQIGFKAKKSKEHEDELAAVLVLKRYIKIR